MTSHARILTNSINNAGYANQPGPMKSIKFPTVAGAVDYHRTWTVNAYGPLLFSSALLDAGLLRKIDAPEQGDSIPPVICNISSGQASLARAAEMFDGGGSRDDLFFHQVYAASKVALSGVTMHMARVLRVRSYPFFSGVVMSRGARLMSRTK
jgi:NAD(P)-dependent dehydrogenase (short-subunit alcohol dehydrogenase family)